MASQSYIRILRVLFIAGCGLFLAYHHAPKTAAANCSECDSQAGCRAAQDFGLTGCINKPNGCSLFGVSCFARH